MAQEIDADQAKKVGDVHEECGSSPADETAMDLHNNKIGISLGTPGADCKEGCLNALSTGALQTSPGGTPPADIYPYPDYYGEEDGDDEDEYCY